MKREQTFNADGFEIPASKDIECMLLSELIQCPENIPTAKSIVKHSMFSVEEYGQVWQTLVAMYDNRDAIDFATISTRIKQPTLMELIQPKYGVGSGSMFSTLEHCRALRNAAIRRKIFVASWSMLQKASTNAVDINELLAMPGVLSEDITNDVVFSNPTAKITDVLNELANDIEQVQRNQENGKRTRIPTGFDFLDKLTYSGFNPGNLVVLAARPSVGKTAIMLQMAKTASRAGFAAAIYSLEMTNQELAQRMLFSTGFVTPGQLINGRVEWESLERANGTFDKMPLYLNDTARTLEDITSDIVANNRNGHCDIAFIDYLGLIQGTNARQPLYQAIGERTAKLKHIAKECRIPIVLLCQLNRELEGESRSPELYDLRDSGSIEQDADIVLMLERESRDLNDKNVNMWLRKNRQGRAGNVLIPLEANETFTSFTARPTTRD